MSSLTNAFANSARSFLSCKAASSKVSEALMTQGPSGATLTHRPDLALAPEQLSHFRGWVYAAVRPIAQRIAGQTIHVGKKSTKRPSGMKAARRRKNLQPVDVEPLTSHPLLDLLADPNDLMVSWSLIYNTIASLEITGRSPWYVPDRKQILPIPVPWLKGFDNDGSRILSFRVQSPYLGEFYDLPAEQCVYFAYPDPADPFGAVSPLQAAGFAVDADENISRSQSAMFANGINPSHAVIVGKNPHPDGGDGFRPHLTSAQQRQIIDAIKRRYSGSSQHGEPLILDGLIEDVKRLSNTAEEMDYLNSSKVTKERILQGFGVNGIIIGQVEGANRASAVEADRHFCEFTINPKITLISQTLTEWFRWIYADDSLVVWIEPCIPDDADMSLRWLGLLASKGALTGDELRELSPFDLKLGREEFQQPLGGQSADDSAALADASNQLKTAVNEIKRPMTIQLPPPVTVKTTPVNRIAQNGKRPTP